MTKIIDLTGVKFNRLTVLGLAQENPVKWKCICECGSGCAVRTDKLKSGHTKSCGCLVAENTSAALTTHGHTKGRSRSLTYKSWTNMLTRTRNPNAINFDRYGGAGITVCQRWERFENFLADMGQRPSRKHSVERVDNQKGYEPGNCIWDTQEGQNANKSITRLVVIDGAQMTLAEACRRFGLRYGTAWLRLKEGRDVRGQNA